MTPHRRFTIVVSLVAAGLAAMGVAGVNHRRDVASSGFAAEVDLSGLESVAVYTDGRVKSFSSFANEVIDAISGPKGHEGHSSVLMYLELMMRPEAWSHEPVIYVKNVILRADILAAVGDRHGDTGGLDAFLETGMIAPHLLAEPTVEAVLDVRGDDLIRSARFVNQVRYAVYSTGVVGLSEGLRMLPPAPDGGERWSSMLDLSRPSAIRQGFDDSAGALVSRGLPAETIAELSGAWLALADGIADRDAPAATAASTALAGLLRAVNPGIYPAERRLQLESFYFRSYNLTWIWMVYLLACMPLLLDLVYQWRPARWLGIGLFLTAFGLHGWALGLRWYISGRWPNSNMFEAVTTAAWMGGVAALVLVFVARGLLGRLFMLTSAAASMVAFLCAYSFPAELNPNISNMMPVLNDYLLYIHTNLIIWSYVIIFMAAVSASLYLLWRAVGGDRSYVKMGGAGMLALGSGGASERHEIEADTNLGTVLDGVTMVMMELSFVMLWTGIVLGALWADHSWGRPWGWDPKEVFALNTFIVFVVLVHTRWKTRDKGLWTAALAVVGAGVMLFNWIVINLKISGLHSYA
jgi:cytochrome c-type biogenesis protein CcsB